MSFLWLALFLSPVIAIVVSLTIDLITDVLWKEIVRTLPERIDFAILKMPGIWIPDDMVDFREYEATAYSPLFRLPRELRDMIYAHVLTVRRRLHYNEFKNQMSIHHINYVPLDLSINSVCRALRDETQDLALKLNCLSFGAYFFDRGLASSMSRFCLFMKRLSPSQRTMVRRVKVCDVMSFRHTDFHELSRGFNGAYGVPGILETCHELADIRVNIIVALSDYAYTGDGDDGEHLGGFRNFAKNVITLRNRGLLGDYECNNKVVVGNECVNLVFDEPSELDRLEYAEKVENEEEGCPNYKWWSENKPLIGLMNGKRWSPNKYGAYERYVEVLHYDPI
ncbi:hypothetical protein BU16DRAFT_542388 [Lophium mytilinum]|uniref:F-box domain-containing protein n=1 Tax=Lophium mytilinum TaxID=390894 RepID=A0A6A6QJ90_9PEZI|nr:hypothetical protein BU16DRAFT_542388 [Lophium mytilinum]